jgi:hypothetical protein
MGLSHAPRVITDGIVLALDAANTRSYVGSGTTWTDLIGSNNGTLTNGPVFTQEPKLEPFGGAGAVEFDGSDYLEIPASSDFSFTTAPWTFECWVYHKDWTTGADGNGIQYMLFPQQSSHPTYPVAIQIHQGRYLILDSANYGSPWYSSYNDISSYGTAASLNTWNHVAYTRDSSGVDRVFVNGTLQFSATGKTNTSSSISSVARFGGTGTGYINGYISNLRLIKGTALYTSNFTPPRKKLEVTSDTVLLTCEKGTIKDRSSSAHDITINGDAKSISGASYFEFDGTNDGVTIPDNENFEIGTASSFECWININTVTTDRLPFGKGSTWWFGVGYTTLGGTSGEFQWLAYDGSSWTTLNTGVTVSANTWYHLVTTWDGTYFRFYANGNLEATSSDLSAKTWSNTTSTVDIGGFVSGLQQMTNQKLSVAKIYTKTLTAAEVSQNFNALRGRYGI